MSDFLQSVESSGVNAALQAAGKALITPEAADLALEVAGVEPISPALLSFTHMCEHSFEIAPSLPNTNGHPESIWKNEKTSWDIGPFQLNFGWTHRSICQGELSFKGLLWVDVFGRSFFEDDGVTPCGFSGKPVANATVAARKLLSHNGTERFGAVRYTGPDHQARRGELYDKLMPSFEQFFKLYKGE